MSQHYLTPGQRVPGYLPYRTPVSNGNIPVPNEAQMFWPQGQLAPEFFPAGHPSFEPFVYPDGPAQIVSNGEDPDFAGADLEFDTEADKKRALRGYAIVALVSLVAGATGMHFYQSGAWR